MRGRKPKPTRLKIAEGQAVMPTAEPMPISELDECPDHLTDGAREEWRRIVREMTTLGLFTALDRAALAAYCQSYATWAHAQEQLEGGLVVKSPNGYPIQNPYWSIATTALKQMHVYAAELGLTPSARTRIKVKQPSADDLDDFFDHSAKVS